MHEAWHVLVLASALFGLASVALLMLAALVFEEMPAELRRTRPLLFALMACAAVIVTLEWTLVH
jgi:predicted membrane channel-forming protein YqfA (hemolysin III family)